MSSNALDSLLFGTGGIPFSTAIRSTEAGILRIAELGLGCMEVEFVQGVKMGPEATAAAGEVAAEKGIALTAHAPYAINLNSVDRAKVHMSRERILQTARAAALFGGRSITFHAAFYLKSTPDETYAAVREQLQKVMNVLRDEGNTVTIRPELAGKVTQFGTLDEILQISAEIEGVAPCIDFAHWHARTGKANSYPEFLAVLDRVEEKLGRQALDDMHIHVSGIAYSLKGERKHLMLPDSDLRYVELLRALKERQAKGVVIVESVPYMEEDALLLQRTYRELP